MCTGGGVNKYPVNSKRANVWFNRCLLQISSMLVHLCAQLHHGKPIYYGSVLTAQALSLVLLRSWSLLFHVNWKSWDCGTCDISALLLNSNVKIMGGKRILMIICRGSETKDEQRTEDTCTVWATDVRMRVYRYPIHSQLSFYPESTYSLAHPFQFCRCVPQLCAKVDREVFVHSWLQRPKKKKRLTK